MGLAWHPYRSARAVKPDWMLVSVGLMALALLITSSIRSTPPHAVTAFGTQIGGLRALGDNESLILFEDLGTGPDPDWSGGARDDSHVGLGAIWLAAPDGAAITRAIALPPGTVRGIVSLDLIAIDAWALARLEVAVNGAPVLRQGFAAGQPEVLAPGGITLRSRLSPPQELGFAAGPGLEESRLTVEMAIPVTDPELRLSILPLPAPGAATDAAPPLWAIDNLVVIAAGG
jgi:hypothetical protein